MTRKSRRQRDRRHAPYFFQDARVEEAALLDVMNRVCEFFEKSYRRSREFHDGVDAALRHRFTERVSIPPLHHGTAACDAFWAGWRVGNDIVSATRVGSLEL